MTGAPYSNPTRPIPVTQRSFKRMGLTLLTVFLIVLAGVGAAVYWKVNALAQEKPPGAETPMAVPWKSQGIYAKPAEDPVLPIAFATPAEPAKPVDTTGVRLALLEQKNDKILAALEDLKKRPTTPAVAPPPPPKRPTPTVIPKPPPGPPLFVQNKLDTATSGAGGTGQREYTLAPGSTKIPAILETKIISDVEGYVTARVSANIYDTASGKHLLIPQGSTILGNTQSSKLVYGNERLDTITLKLAFPDGRSVDLKHAPITDEAGVAGLTGDVNSHYGRLLAAVLIQGVLKGGSQAISTAAAGAAGAQVITGVSSTGAQTGTQITGPLLSTKPTITVPAGQIVTVILLEPLKLPAMWE